MPRTLRYGAQAVADLDDVRHWHTQAGSGFAAIRKLQAIRAAIRALRRTPCLYPVGNHPGVREMACLGHRIMYVVEPDTGRNDSAGDVLILRVFGPGQLRH